MTADQPVLVARIGAARGLKGEVALDVRTDHPLERFAVGERLRTDNAAQPLLTVVGTSTHAGRFYVRFAEVVTREDAEALRGAELLAEAAPEDDAWYSHELVGLTAVDQAGQRLGTVRDLLIGAAQDLLVIDTDSGEVLVPFVDEIVPEVLVAQGRVVLNPPAGLFELADD